MNGDLKPNEPHPAAQEALTYIKQLGIPKLMFYVEAFASTALSGNRTSDICSETLRRICAGESVSDRYVLGLAWTIRTMEELNEATSRNSSVSG